VADAGQGRRHPRQGIRMPFTSVDRTGGCG